jgi:hypothetical protein
MISYSPKAARALGMLKSHFNDIEIYVEDTGSPNMWLTILKKIIPPNVRLHSVSLLGGRDNVLKACKLDQAKSARRRLYIIDGDFDFLLGKPKPRLKHVYRLRGYCIESLLIREELAVQAGILCHPKWSGTEIERHLDIPGWLEAVTKPLLPLFVVYAAVRRHLPRTKTVSYSVTNLYSNTPSGPVICPVRVQRRVLAVVREVCRQIDKTLFFYTFKEIKARSSTLSWRQVISGKDYVLSLLRLRMRRIVNFAGSDEQLKLALAAQWISACEPYFSRRIRSI